MVSVTYTTISLQTVVYNTPLYHLLHSMYIIIKLLLNRIILTYYYFLPARAKVSTRSYLVLNKHISSSSSSYMYSNMGRVLPVEGGRRSYGHDGGRNA